MTIRKLFTFEAAHVLPYHLGKCSRLHGHSYRLEVAVEGSLKTSGPDRGMVTDFGDISAVVKAVVIECLDHQSLNDIVSNPTCERVLLWIADALSPRLSNLAGLVLWETETACAALGQNDIVVAGQLLDP
jgi:6-pyruvoyltetrahydropterin/6-carboxytetrahydropterin synthase